MQDTKEQQVQVSAGAFVTVLLGAGEFQGDMEPSARLLPGTKISPPRRWQRCKGSEPVPPVSREMTCWVQKGGMHSCAGWHTAAVTPACPLLPPGSVWSLLPESPLNMQWKDLQLCPV